MIKKTLLTIIVLQLLAFYSIAQQRAKIISHVCMAQDVRMHWKDNNGHILGSIANTLQHLQSTNKKVAMIMNGGMYLKDQSPQGLYIEKGELIKELDKKKSNYGNFYMQPNGVFYITKDNKVFIVTTQNFKSTSSIKYATQSGPMLVVNGHINNKFLKGSKHLNIRNGVGLLPNGQIIFAISTEEVSLFDFADFFKQKGCRQALYLDGYISKMYLSNGEINQRGGSFGVIISTKN